MKMIITIAGSRSLLYIFRISILVTCILAAAITSMATTPDNGTYPSSLQKAWVILYDGQDFQHNMQVIHGGENITDLDSLEFDNKCISIRYKIPVGWAVVLYDEKNFQEQGVVLSGTGRTEEITVLASFAQQASSIRWERELD